MSTMCSTYGADRRYYRLSSTPRGAPAHHYRAAVDNWLPALMGLLIGISGVAYIAQVVA